MLFIKTPVIQHCIELNDNRMNIYSLLLKTVVFQVGECLECQSIIAVKLETDSIPIEAGECTVNQTNVFTIKEESDPTPLQTGECMESQASVSTIKEETDSTSLKAEERKESQLSVVTIEETEMDTTPLEANQPFEFVGMYLIGKVAKTKTGNKFICVMVDYYTRWSEAFALPSKTAANVAGCIMKFFYRFGAPKRIFIGQSQEFINKLNKVLCKSLGGQHRLCARHYPQTNELFEKLHETVRRALSELVSQRPGSWDMYLDAMMFVLRTKKHITTEFSPFFLLFGIEARHASEIP
ncbi:putative gypsy retrotransposon integrase-like protein 1-like [Triplophysa rosa]|uniref:Gypsy retrotransposon integrase-like protein 1-like n=1 Tax=Triplophysa rosa TaxID=992332 RepID=A0A9W7TBJ7_TRIRA|nr:putative gypsy retrotransposon integrase-like protein 1-like [Triplophysa rosa]